MLLDPSLANIVQAGIVAYRLYRRLFGGAQPEHPEEQPRPQEPHPVPPHEQQQPANRNNPASPEGANVSRTTEAGGKKVRINIEMDV